MKTIKRILLIIGCIAVAIAIIIFVGLSAMSKKTQEALAKQVNADIEMSEVQDGVYTGASDGGMVQVQVEVTVQDHKLTAVQILEHQNGKGQPAEIIVQNMVAENTYDVDAVSGATISSKTIKNAVNQALLKGVD